MTVRPVIVDLLIAGCAGDLTPQRFDEVKLEATEQEVFVAYATLAMRGARSIAAQRNAAEPSMLAWDQPTLYGIARQRARQSAQLAREAHALYWLGDQQLGPAWDPRPTEPLSNILKTQRQERVAYLAKEMHGVGLHDLCNHEDDEEN